MGRRVTAGHIALRASEHNTHEPATPPWELAALDADGNELYRTEYQDSEQEAREAAADLNEGGIPDRLPDEVARFEAVETEE